METSRPTEDWNKPQPQPQQENKRVLVGVMAIILGSIGVHKFILGYNNEGIALLVLSIISYLTFCIIIGAFLVWIPILIGIIEGIVYLSKTDNEFYQTYQVNKRAWF